MEKLRKTKIVCTLGPATEDDRILREMILSGMNVARLNFSHGTHEGHLKNIQRVRSMSESMNRPIGIMLDTKGPEIRLTNFKEGKVTLTKGQHFTLCTYPVEGTAEKAGINFSRALQDALMKQLNIN